MFDRFVVIKEINNNINLDDFYKSLFGNASKIEKNDNFTIIYHNLADEELIKNSLLTLGDDLLLLITAYISNPSYDMNGELKIALELLKSAKSGVYNLKTILLSNEENKMKNEVFDLITDNMGIDANFIKTFVKNNLNTSKSAKELFIHRNTLIYKIDRFQRERNFDLRNFIDCFILYSLIDSKL